MTGSFVSFQIPQANISSIMPHENSIFFLKANHFHQNKERNLGENGGNATMCVIDYALSIWYFTLEIPII